MTKNSRDADVAFIQALAAVLDEKDTDQVLEPFHSTDKGLGMASAFGIVKKHNGVMTVSRGGEKGSVFSVYLPVINS